MNISRECQRNGDHRDCDGMVSLGIGSLMTGCWCSCRDTDDETEPTP